MSDEFPIIMTSGTLTSHKSESMMKYPDALRTLAGLFYHKPVWDILWLDEFHYTQLRQLDWDALYAIGQHLWKHERTHSCPVLKPRKAHSQYDCISTNVVSSLLKTCCNTWAFTVLSSGKCSFASVKDLHCLASVLYEFLSIAGIISAILWFHLACQVRGEMTVMSD